MTAQADKIEFFFDIGSPYSYLCACKVDEIGARVGLPVVWRPFLLGGVFKGAGNVMPASVAAKATWMLSDLQAWARRYGVEFRFSARFPLNTLKTQRALTAVAQTSHDDMRAFAEALFDAYWIEDRDVSDLDEIGRIATEAGLDADTVVAAAGEQSVKDALRETTDEAVRRGAFGAPTMFVGDRMYWGNDRLELLASEVENPPA